MSEATSPAVKPATELIKLTIDDKEVSVPKGTMIITAAKQAGIDIPFYCYHPHLSSPGNCRMCQVEVQGAPKMQIACSVPVAEGMVVRTQNTSDKVKDTQASTLEFILINHPLDCTVCDQAGHCKLQDYHYEYNARPSRFLEEKEHKVKAEPLGPTVMLDGERCIMCTRCIRFCDEVTKTSELGMLNRGDRSVISVDENRPLDNPLSGTVVDLCPVGALTHKKWRFNTRIWYTEQINSICPGCSTGCNVKVAVRDGQVVNVKARLNPEVNKEWLCDEGRYGFDRFLPTSRLTTPRSKTGNMSWEQVTASLKLLKDLKPLVFVAPDLLLEEYQLIKVFLDKCVKEYEVAVAYKERQLSDVEKVLISPDYAANFAGAKFAGLNADAADYDRLVNKLKTGGADAILCFGDRAFDQRDIDGSLLSAISRTNHSMGSLADSESELAGALSCVLPAKTVLEKAGLMVNRGNRLQYTDVLLQAPEGALSDWSIVSKLGASLGVALTDCTNDRELTISYLKSHQQLSGISIKDIKAGGIDLNQLAKG